MKNEVIPENLIVLFQQKRGAQKAVADALGITAGAISQWKSGARPVPSEYIPTICRVLNIEEDVLYSPMFIQTCPANGIKGRLSAVMDKLKESDQLFAHKK